MSCDFKKMFLSYPSHCVQRGSSDHQIKRGDRDCVSWHNKLCSRYQSFKVFDSGLFISRQSSQLLCTGRFGSLDGLSRLALPLLKQTLNKCLYRAREQGSEDGTKKALVSACILTEPAHDWAQTCLGPSPSTMADYMTHLLEWALPAPQSSVLSCIASNETFTSSSVIHQCSPADVTVKHPAFLQHIFFIYFYVLFCCHWVLLSFCISILLQ